jgi:TRAP-type C4-dicarboxylate transport system permease small subunit
MAPAVLLTPTFEDCMELFKKFDRFLTVLEKGFVGIGILGTTVLVFSAVITRHFLDFSPPWIEELTEDVTLWIVFVGAALCIKKTEHVNVDIIFHIISPKTGQVLMGVLCVLSSVFLLYFSYASSILVANVKATHQMSISMDWLPMYTVYASAVVGSLLMVLEFFKLGWRFFLGEEPIKK